MSKLIEGYKQKAKLMNKTVVLPEGEEPRVIKAAGIIAKEGFAKIILLGKEDVIKEKCPDVCLDGVTIIDPQNNPKIDEYAKITGCALDVKQGYGTAVQPRQKYAVYADVFA